MEIAAGAFVATLLALIAIVLAALGMRRLATRLRGWTRRRTVKPEE